MKSKALILFLISLLWACAPETKDPNRFQIVCTTGMLADAVSALVEGIDSVEVISLMGPGTDPHLYKASQADVFALSRGDLIVYNGLHLEGKMHSLFKKLDSDRVLAAAEGIPKAMRINASEFENAWDPHVWFDLSLWAITTSVIRDKLMEVLPKDAELIAKNEKAYRKAIIELHHWAVKTIREIPENQRVLITAHDAFKYFGRAYGLEVRGLQGISTTAEFGIRDISNLAHFITDRNIKAVFVESSVSPRAIQAVRSAVKEQGHTLNLGGELYSDALGSPETGANTFFGMFRHNVQTISAGLR